VPAGGRCRGAQSLSRRRADGKLTDEKSEANQESIKRMVAELYVERMELHIPVGPVIT
jgi:hypothetical protein